SYDEVVKNILVTLDVSELVVDEAIKNNVNLIISHHPLLFQPLKEINIRTSKGRIIKKLLNNNITVYSAHTNLDIAENGVNDELAKQLQLKNISPLISTGREQLYKIVVFVPETDVEQVRQALGNSGAGHIGNYSHCTFQGKGEGTFKPLEGTDPYIGEKNQL